MDNPGFTKIGDFRDMPTLNEYKHLESTGGDIPQFIKRIAFESRG